MAPLNKQLQKCQPVGSSPLDETELSALEAFKTAHIQPPVLAVPDANGPHTLDRNACDVQIGCVLLQKQHGDTLKPIGYWFCSFNVAERKYNPTQREWIANFKAVLHLRPFLEPR